VPADEPLAPRKAAIVGHRRESLLVSTQVWQELVRDVTETLAKWGLAPSDLEFDVTEATLAQLTWTQNPILRSCASSA